VNAEVAGGHIRQSVEGWRDGDAAEILATVTEDCAITESHGLTYHGKDQVVRWVETWFGAAGALLAWEIRSLEATHEATSVVRFRDEKIVSIREYATTALIYDWEGVWR
jgi:ketosteroid isomerase-like protein